MAIDGAIYLQPDIFDLEQHLSIKLKARQIIVHGPAAASHLLMRLQALKSEESFHNKCKPAQLSPLASVTLDAASRRRAGIPNDAAFYAYCHPHVSAPGVAAQLMHEVVGAVG